MVHSHLTATEKALRAFVYRERGTRSPLTENEKQETRLGSIEDEIWSSFSFCKPTWEGVGAFLGVGPHESSRNPVIDVFASNHTLSFVSVGKPVINTVEDVKRDFYQNFEHMVREKLSNGPFTTTRIDVPKEQTLPVETCVYRLTWPGKSNQIHEKSAMIGLFREPGSIKVSQWDVPMDEWNLPVDESTRDLQRSISKYVSRILLSKNVVIFQLPLQSTRAILLVEADMCHKQSDMPIITTALTSSCSTHTICLLFRSAQIAENNSKAQRLTSTTA